MNRFHLLATGACLMSQAPAPAAPLPAAQEETGAAASPGEMPDYERIGRFIYAFHRAGANPQTLRDPDLARDGPPGLAARARALADRYDAVIKANASLADSEIKSTLREAAEVGGAVEEWRGGRRNADRQVCDGATD